MHFWSSLSKKNIFITLLFTIFISSLVITCLLLQNKISYSIKKNDFSNKSKNIHFFLNNIKTYNTKTLKTLFNKPHLNNIKYIGLFDHNISLIYEKNFSENDHIIAHMMNNSCGLKKIKITLKPCITQYHSKFVGYFPLVKKTNRKLTLTKLLVTVTPSNQPLKLTYIPLYLSLFGTLGIICFSILFWIISRQKREASHCLDLIKNDNPPKNNFILFKSEYKQTFDIYQQNKAEFTKIKDKLNQSNEKLLQLKSTNSVLKDQLDEANRSKLILLANTSHDIRTPLNAINGFVEKLREFITDKTARNYLNIIKNNTFNLICTVDAALNYNSMTNNSFIYNNEIIYIADEIETYIEANNSYSENKQNNFIFAIIHENVPNYFYSYKLAFQQIIGNILSNSIKYTESGNISVDVSYQAFSPNKGQLTMIFKDQGIGLNEHEIENMFDTYSQHHKHLSRQNSGSGLGLTIVRHGLEALSGNYKIKSKKQVGTTITVTIPIQKVFFNTIRQNKNILIIDNDYELALSTITKAHRAGYKTIHKTTIENIQNNEHPIVIIRIDTLKQFQNMLPTLYTHLKTKKIILLTNESPLTYKKYIDHYDLDVLSHSFTTKTLKNIISSNHEHIITLENKKENEQQFKDISVLIADDNHSNIQLLQVQLEYTGMIIDTCINGQELVDKCKKQHYDLLLVDMYMPEISGYEAIEIIKKQPGYQLTAIIAVTASTTKNEHDMFSKIVDDILIKPIQKQTLYDMIYQCLATTKQLKN